MPSRTLDEDRAAVALAALKAGVNGLCACTIHESGRGLSPCIGHATRIREHQEMYAALKALANCTIGRDTDPGTYAEAVLDKIHYWHEDHPMPTLSELDTRIACQPRQ